MQLNDEVGEPGSLERSKQKEAAAAAEEGGNGETVHAPSPPTTRHHGIQVSSQSRGISWEAGEEVGESFLRCPKC